MIPWSASDVRTLRRMHAAGKTIAEAAERIGRSPNAVGQQARKQGLHFLRPGHRPWTAKEIRTLRQRFPNELTADVARDLGRPYTLVAQKALKLGLRKSARGLRAASARLSHVAKTSPGSIAGRFKKGQVPANKGLRRPGWAPGRMAETQFKKGELSGRARALLKPVGATRIVYGNLERKMTDGGPYPAARWKPVHRLVWEAAHGPVPKGHIVVFKPGQHTIVENEITLDRIELITLADNMRRNTIHNYPPAIKDAMRMRGVLGRAIRKAEKRNQCNE